MSAASSGESVSDAAMAARRSTATMGSSTATATRLTVATRWTRAPPTRPLPGKRVGDGAAAITGLSAPAEFLADVEDAPSIKEVADEQQSKREGAREEFRA